MFEASNIYTDFNSYFASAYFSSLVKTENILLITGRNSFHLSGAAQELKELSNSDNCLTFNDFSVNPKIDDVIRGAKLASDSHVKHIIAIGGGSVIDMAKLIVAVSHRLDNVEEIIKGVTPVEDNKIALSCVPTTAGSGSESTHFAVAYIGNSKYSVASPALYADHIVLDHALIKSNTPYQLAVNGLDALAQGIESAWAIGSTSTSRKYSFDAIEKASRCLPKIIKNPIESDFKEMMLAAHLAGKAINISKTTSAHAFSYGFTSMFGVPHGHAVWLTLPQILKFHAECDDELITDPRGLGFYKDNLSNILQALGVEKINLAQQINDFLLKIDIESDMRKMGAKSSADRQQIANMVNLQRLKNNPVTLHQDTIGQIFSL